MADEVTWSMMLRAWFVTCLYFSRSGSRDLWLEVKTNFQSLVSSDAISPAMPPPTHLKDTIISKKSPASEGPSAQTREPV